jgi:hypothetical protein
MQQVLVAGLVQPGRRVSPAPRVRRGRRGQRASPLHQEESEPSALPGPSALTGLLALPGLMALPGLLGLMALPGLMELPGLPALSERRDPRALPVRAGKTARRRPIQGSTSRAVTSQIRIRAA